VVAGDCDAKLGWLMDYAEISDAFRPLWEKLDHNYLNGIPGLENPTSENVAAWIWRRLKTKTAGTHGSCRGRNLHRALCLSGRMNPRR